MIELLRKRRSIRKFTHEKIAPATIETLIEVALRAQSSRGINPWAYIKR
jgi:nitroreductase